MGGLIWLEPPSTKPIEFLLSQCSLNAFPHGFKKLSNTLRIIYKRNIGSPIV